MEQHRGVKIERKFSVLGNGARKSWGQRFYPMQQDLCTEQENKEGWGIKKKVKPAAH